MAWRESWRAVGQKVELYKHAMLRAVRACASCWLMVLLLVAAASCMAAAAAAVVAGVRLLLPAAWLLL